VKWPGELWPTSSPASATLLSFRSEKTCAELPVRFFAYGESHFRSETRRCLPPAGAPG